ncbi:MFS transporter [Sinisalibacter aestuarii]|uniref:MFS transporter n=1 Tax=Sinisalibacter aestuarii TaxID=2949426 RepID=A0ABQ5LYA6_9RHOB|nr:MFS transporter [Sinisalibacter aestuarii]GKY89944.1 MFS transporter [Sinisalibacter aestuarii]
MSAIRHAGFAKYMAANVVSYSGLWIERVALGWYAWETTQSTFWTGFVAVAYVAPSGILGPFLGVLAENWPMRRAAILVNIALALISTLLFVTVRFFEPGIVVIAAISLLIGTASAAMHPVRLVMVSQIVPPGLLSGAVRLNAAAFNVTRIAGPALAGVLIAAIGTENSLAVNPITFLPIIFVLAHIPLAERPRSALRAGTPRQGLVDGLRYVVQDGLIRWCILATSINAIFVRSVIEIMPAITGGALDGDSHQLAILTSTAGIGALAASLAMNLPILASRDVFRTTMVALAVGTLSVTIAGLFPVPLVMTGALAAAAASATIVAIGTQATLHVSVAEDYRARTLTWWTTTSFGAIALSGFALGALGDLVPMSAVVAGAGLAGIAVAAWLGLRGNPRAYG